MSDTPPDEPIGEPEETDNAPRPEDGEQDIDQGPDPTPDDCQESEPTD
jgi:hypothetical protein